MHFTHRFAAALLGASFLHSVPALAAETAADAADSVDSDAESPAILVTGSRESDTVLPQRPPRSIYGLEASVVDTPRSISQISGAQLERDPLKSTDDFVKYAPGITRGGGQGNNASPSIRGIASEVFQNGQRIYKEGNDHPLNLNAFEGADIVAGPSSVIFGPSSGTGGYVNYITKKPFFDQHRTQVSAEIGSWVPGDSSESWSDFALTADTGGPISDKLAYRVSLRGKRGGTYYRNVENNYNSAYGALTWKPDSAVTVDWNLAYDDYYDFNVTRGWNRPTQELVDNFGSYYAGRATPLINTPGVGIWSPVFASSDPTAAPIGWQTRTRSGQARFLPGPVQTTPLPSATPAGAGTIVGWIYDPTIPGNELQKIKGSVGSGRPEDKSDATRLTSQLQVGWVLNDALNLLSSTYFQRSRNDNDSVGSFLYRNRSTLVDQRLELRAKAESQIGGLTITLQSNTGFSYRSLTYSAKSANNNFNYNPYDLTLDPSTITPAALYGLPLANPDASGSWIGAPGSAQLTPYFGYLIFPSMISTGDGYYAEVGGTPPGGAVYTSTGSIKQVSLFTQQNLRFGDFGGVNLGVNVTRVTGAIRNPVFINAAQAARADKQNFTLPSYQASAYVKLTANSTLYFTWDRSEALNTGVFGSFLVWGANNQLNELAFHSVSTLYEAGAKADLIPNKLFASVSAFRQSRDTTPDTNGNIAKVKIEGVEAALRAQPSERLAIGINGTYLKAVNTYIVPAGFSPFGFFADGVTVWGDSNRLIGRTGGRYGVPGVPKYSANGFIDYRLKNGLGAELAVWYTGKFFTNLSQSVTVPAGYQANVTLSYRQPSYDVALRLVNITNQKNFLNALTGGEFLQPLQPFHVQGQFAVRF